MRRFDLTWFVLGIFAPGLAVLMARGQSRVSAALGSIAVGILVRFAVVGLQVPAEYIVAVLAVGAFVFLVMNVAFWFVRRSEPELPPLEPEPGEEYIVRQVRKRR